MTAFSLDYEGHSLAAFGAYGAINKVLVLRPKLKFLWGNTGQLASSSLPSLPAALPHVVCKCGIVFALSVRSGSSRNKVYNFREGGSEGGGVAQGEPQGVGGKKRSERERNGRETITKSIAIAKSKAKSAMQIVEIMGLPEPRLKPSLELELQREGG